MNPHDPLLSREGILRRNNVRMHGHDSGHAPLVFVNGFGCEQSVWRSVAPHFAASRKIVLFDHVGVGRASLAAFDPVRHASLQGFADDLLEVCDAVGAPDAVLVAHSAGATIAMLAALRAPAAFRQLVLLAPSPCYRNDGSYLGGFEPEDLEALVEAMELNFRQWSHHMAPLIVGHPERPELAWELESSFNRMDRGIAARFGRASFAGDHRAGLACLSTPTVVLQGTDDNLVPEVVGEYLRETIPDCRLVSLAVAGHCPHLSDPDVVTAALRRVLDESWAATAPAELG